MRRNWLFFLLVTIAGLALRLFFVFRYPHVAGDTWVYGDIAKNWLDHGIFGVTRRNCSTSKNFATGTISLVVELMRIGENIP